MDTFLNDIAKIQEFHALGKAAGSALNDGMVERLASTAAGGLELLDRLNDPDTKAAVHRLIDGVTSLHASGGMDTLFEMATVVHAVRSAASDEMVERLYYTVEMLVTNLATREIAEQLFELRLLLRFVDVHLRVERGRLSLHGRRVLRQT